MNSFDLDGWNSFEKIEDVARATAPLLISGNIGLSGGNTYKRLFREWSKIITSSSATLLPVDERVVPISSPDSNWGNAIALLLSPLQLNSDLIKSDSADHYIKKLKDRLSQTQFDTIFLGMGDDGHIASLFPDGEGLSEKDPDVVETLAPKAPNRRVSLSLNSIIRAKKIILIIDGEEKREVFSKIFRIDSTLPVVKLLLKRVDCEVWYPKSFEVITNKQMEKL